MSVHIHKAQEKARRMGAFAGHPDADGFWYLSKRELVELVIRLGAQANGAADSVKAGCALATAELATLHRAGVL